jgi:outer membrane scaffolding protein for murein synthesis (MipA/OmpV family)
MQEWQYSGGIILARLFEPELPDWRVILGAAAETQPIYSGAHAYRVQGGADGTVGDVGIYMPLPGSSRKFVMFAGPSVTFATHRNLQSEFGVTPAQSLASGHPAFDAHAGMESVGVGFSATRFLTPHWLLNIDAAITKLKGSPDVSPITETSTQRELALSIDYQW